MKGTKHVQVGFYNALTYTTSYFGWPTDVVDELTAVIEGTIPKFFV